MKIMYKTFNNQLTLAQRLKSPTPKFFRTLRTIGLVLLAASGVIISGPLAFPVVLPAIVTQVAGYVALAGTVVSAISQTAVDTDVEQPEVVE